MTPATITGWEERLKTAVRSQNDELLRQALYSLRRVPGFREIRREAFRLAKLAKAEWTRHRTGDFPHPDVFIGFLGKFKVAETLSTEKPRFKAAAGKEQLENG